ncbi:MAG: hypothetical protein V4714_07125 [Bacteroidota bacterium]
MYKWEDKNLPAKKTYGGIIRRWGSWLLFFVLIQSQEAQAQLSNLKTQWISTKPGTKTASSFTLLPESLEIVQPVDTNWKVLLNPEENTVSFLGNNLPDSIQIRYRVFPFNLNRIQFHRNRAVYDSAALYEDRPLVGAQSNRPADTREELFSTKGLQKNGTITRGISLGNTQNVFVNSALNLQLDGQLSDDISLTAVISDQQVPFQPEGNTQQLQQFDKVFVQLGYHNKQKPSTRATLTVGDIVMRNQPINRRGVVSSFLRYYKNVQGGQVAASYSLGKNKDTTAAFRAQTALGIAVAKGKFASTLVTATEGSQGPYRLRGPNDERFIIVLANSEKVYLDGQLLKRGVNFDYVIDYNQAEIIFNTNIVITKFSRIRIDFEYSDRNYSRTVTQAQHTQQINHLNVFGGYYSERDNPRNPLLVTLTDEDKLLLSQIGDSLQKAVVPGATLLSGYDPNMVLYRKVDSTVNNTLYPGVYVYSTDTAKAHYQLAFTELGQGKGNYRLKSNTLNGRLYEWIAPLNGILQGTFEPVRQLPTPTKKQMFTLGGNYELNAKETIFGEMAFSERDVNLFSSLGSTDDQGHALKFGYANKGRSLKFLPGYEWIGSVDYERDSRYFRPIDRFRDIEYDRDWSANPDSSLATDQIFNASIGLQASANASTAVKEGSPIVGDRLLYRFSQRERGLEINGMQHRIDLSKSLGKWQLLTNFFSLHNQKALVTSDWHRLRTEVAYRGNILVPGYIYSLDRNTLKASNDVIVGTAMNFDEHKFYLRTNDSLRTRFNADYAYRQDNDTLEGNLVRNNVAHTANLGLAAKVKDKQDLNLIFTYRTIENLRIKIPTDKPSEETLMGRLDWNADFFGRVIRSELTFAVATGRELKREYVFLPVPTGQGTHTWRDENHDGVKDLNEFYEALNFDERNYAKFFVPTDQYTRAYTNNFNYRLNITPPRRWHEGGPMLAFLSKLSSVSSWSINKRITDDRVWERFAPFASIAQENILSNQSILRSTLFFNRANPRYGMDMTFLNSQQKQLLTNGFEGRNNQEYKFNARLNLHQRWTTRAALTHAQRTTQSDFLSSRNYRIDVWQTKPELSYQPSNNFRVTGAYTYADKHNNFTENATEAATFHEASLETRWTKVSERTLTASLRYVKIAFVGDPNTALGYELLEALRPGNNLTWSLNWQQKIASGLQLTFNYDGRQAAASPTVHIGRIQLMALS